MDKDPNKTRNKKSITHKQKNKSEVDMNEPGTKTVNNRINETDTNTNSTISKLNPEITMEENATGNQIDSIRGNINATVREINDQINEQINYQSNEQINAPVNQLNSTDNNAQLPSSNTELPFSATELELTARTNNFILDGDSSDTLISHFSLEEFLNFNGPEFHTACCQGNEDVINIICQIADGTTEITHIVDNKDIKYFLLGILTVYEMDYSQFINEKLIKLIYKWTRQKHPFIYNLEFLSFLLDNIEDWRIREYVVFTNFLSFFGVKKGFKEYVWKWKFIEKASESNNGGFVNCVASNKHVRLFVEANSNFNFCVIQSLIESIKRKCKNMISYLFKYN